MSKQREWTTGIHAVSELIKQRPASIERLLLAEERGDRRITELLELARNASIKVETVSSKQLREICQDSSQGVAALTRQGKAGLSEKDLLVRLRQVDHQPLLLVLDGVTDPHNLGACLRTADAAGVDAVIVPKDKSASMSSTVSKVASGAAETIDLVTVTNLSRCLRALQESGVWLVGTDDSADSDLYSQDLTGPVALVMGSEGTGLRRLTREHCDFLVSIPMAGGLSSLNVSVASGVALFEAVRQRRQSSI